MFLTGLTVLPSLTNTARYVVKILVNKVLAYVYYVIFNILYKQKINGTYYFYNDIVKILSQNC